MLSKEELGFLEENGFLDLGQLLTDEEVGAINNRIDELLVEEGENAGSELAESKYIRHPKEEGADRLADLVNKGAIFDVFYTHPKVLAGIAAVLGDDYKLSSLNYRAAKPGKGLQKLHVDYKNAVVDGAYKVCNSIWLLDDFTPENGATRIVPGTHRSDRLPDQVLDDPYLPHPEEILINAPAGSVFIFNSHVWHGGTTNTTSRTRRSIHSYFCAADQPQQIDQKKYITEETRKRIGDRARRYSTFSPCNLKLAMSDPSHAHYRLYKPFGMLSQLGSKDPVQLRKKRFLAELYPFRPGTMPIGRLDEKSEGLLLMTTDGKLSDTVNRSGVEKEYFAQLDGCVTEAALEKMRRGIEIGMAGKKYITQACKVCRIGVPDLPEASPKLRIGVHRPTSWISMTLTEGKFRQVRKMTAAAGFPTLRLVRMRIGHTHLGELRPGEVEELQNVSF